MQPLIKKAGMATEKQDFNAKKITRDKEEYYTMIKGQATEIYSNTKCGNTNQ